MKAGTKVKGKLKQEAKDGLYSVVFRDSTAGKVYDLTFYPKGHTSLLNGFEYVANGFEYVDDVGDTVEAFVTDFDVVTEE